MNKLKSLKTIFILATLIPSSIMILAVLVYLNSSSSIKNEITILHEELEPARLEVQKLENLAIRFQNSTYGSVENQKLFNEEYLNIKLKLNTIFENKDLKGSEKKLMKVFLTFEQLQALVLSTPGTEEQQSKFEKSNILHKYKELDSNLQNINRIIENHNKTQKAEIFKLMNNESLTIYAFIAILFIIGLLSSISRYRALSTNVDNLAKTLKDIAKGKTTGYNISETEIIELEQVNTEIKHVVSNLKSTSTFAEKIGKGDYDVSYQPVSDKDVLGNALLDMKNNLIKVKEEDNKRNWVTEGHALFAEILRENTDNIEKLSNELLRKTVKYLGANQGAIYVIDNNRGADKFMKMTSCYAWGRKKYKDGKIFKGEGLTGQVWLEQELMYLTDIPDSYMNITSGLGEANPNALLIAPLIVNEEVYGILEIASFNEFEDHQILFIQKLTESIASTISNTKINERTQLLLEESQEMTEQMMAQEEEMRQNMEELQATQEEMERKEKNADTWEKLVQFDAILFKFDDSFKIKSFEETNLDKLGYSAQNIRNIELTDLIIEDNLKDQILNLTNNQAETFVWRFKNKDESISVFKVKIQKKSKLDQNKEEYYLYATDITTINVAV